MFTSLLSEVVQQQGHWPTTTKALSVAQLSQLEQKKHFSQRLGTQKEIIHVRRHKFQRGIAAREVIAIGFVRIDTALEDPDSPDSSFWGRRVL